MPKNEVSCYKYRMPMKCIICNGNRYDVDWMDLSFIGFNIKAGYWCSGCRERLRYRYHNLDRLIKAVSSYLKWFKPARITPFRVLTLDDIRINFVPSIGRDRALC